MISNSGSVGKLRSVPMLCWTMSMLLLIVTGPAPCAFALNSTPEPPRELTIVPKAKTVTARTGAHKLTKITPKFSLGAHPSDLELSSARLFFETLVPMSGAPEAGENEALGSALKTYHDTKDKEDVSALTDFIAHHPKSRWTPSIELNAGLQKFHSGYLNEAMELWHNAWEAGKQEKSPGAAEIASRSFAHLVLVNARLGRLTELQKYFAEAKDRHFYGSDLEMVKSAQDGMWFLRNTPESAYKCGPLAVNTLSLLKSPKLGTTDFVKKVNSTKDGTNLAQLKDWADQAKLKYQLAKRDAGAPVLIPCVMHWSANHFAAIISKSNNHYVVKDPTFDTDATVAIKADVLDKESDGYFLVPEGPLPNGWHSIDKTEAAKVWGKGYASFRDPNHMRKPCPSNCTYIGRCGCNFMAQAFIWAMNAAVNIRDIPLSYSPPIGQVDFSVNYNQGEANEPSTFTFTNLGRGWNFNWTSYLTVDPSSQTATVRIPGGGAEVYVQSGGVYSPDVLSQALLVNMGSGVYQRQLKDGSIQVYNQPDGSGNIFMTEQIDPQGNSVLIQYDSNFRVTSITDAVNQVSTISYVSNVVGNSGFYKVASISDPFGRSCSFTYDATNTFLTKITDVIGLTSQFLYDTSSSNIVALTTPYGTTSFSSYVPGNNGYPATGLRVQLPDGTQTVTENWLNEPKLTYYWDREATMLYPNDPANQDYSHCQQTKFCYEGSTAGESGIPQWQINPLESASPIYFYYPNQINGDYTGSIASPNFVTRNLGSPNRVCNLGGTPTPGDVLQIIMNNNFCYYTVQTGDTLNSIATGLANSVNSNSALVSQYGIFAAASGPNVLIGANIANDTIQLSTSVNNGNGGTETLAPHSQMRQIATWTWTGTLVAGSPIYMSLPNVTIPYTIQTGDTYASLATTFANLINSNTQCQAQGITAVASGPSILFTSYSNQTMTYNYGGYGGWSFYISNNLNGTAQTFQKQYNSLGYLTQEIDPIGRTFSYSYAANNIDLLQKTETQYQDNFQIGAWTYNSQHRPLTYTDGSGQVTHYSYNSSGQLLSITDANSNVTNFTYTGTATATVGGTATTGDVLTVTVHDAGLSGGQEAVPYTVPAGATTTTIATGIAAAINADTHLQAIGVTATSAAAVVTLKSTSVNVTSYTESTSGGATETIALTANVFGFLTKIDGPMSGTADVTLFTYDSYNRLATRTDSEGYVIAYSYDNGNRPTLTTYMDGTTEQTIYDRLDAVFSKDRIGRWSQSCYNDLDQLIYQIDPLGRKTTYTWCNCGSLASLTDPNGNVTSWQHDLEARPVTKTYADGTRVNYTYEPCTSRVRTRTDALNQTTTYLYNVDDTLSAAGYTGSVHPTAPSSYTYDLYYNRITTALKNDWGSYSYTYNPYIVPSGTPTTGGGMLQLVHNNVIPNSDITYTYDVLGRTSNRSINGSSNSVTWTYDAMSRVTAEANALGNFGYTYVDDTPGASKGTTRLASINYPNSQVTNFSWYPNIGDQRLQQIANLNPSGGTLSQFNYAYDSAGEITQWQQQQNGNNLVYNLGYDLAGQLTTARAGSGGAQSPSAFEYYYGYDPGANRTSVQNASLQTFRVGGTITTGDVLTLTVSDSGLTGGSEAVSYTVAAGDTLATVAQGLATKINLDVNLHALGVIANAHGTNTYLNVRSVSPNVTTYSVTKSGGATETVTPGIYENGSENLVVGGTKKTGDVLTLTVRDAALSGGSVSVSHTVTSTDTLTTIATALKTAINGNSSLSSLGVTATSAGTVVNIASTSTNATTYGQSTNSGATETLTLAPNNNQNLLVSVGGTVTAADQLKINVYDPALSGGTTTITYTVAAGDTTTSIATGLTTAINASTALQGIGVSATSSANLIAIKSNSANTTNYRQSYSTSATESLNFTTSVYGWQVTTIGGTVHAGDVLSITALDPALASGQETISYTVLSTDTLATIASGLVSAINADANLQTIGVTAFASSNVVNLESLSLNPTTYVSKVSSGSTETVALGKSIGATQAAFNNVNELVSLAPGGGTFFSGTTNKPVSSTTLSSQIFALAATSPTVTSTVTTSASSTPGESFSFGPAPSPPQTGVSYTFALNGTVRAGDVVTLNIYEQQIPATGSLSFSYVVQPGDTTTSVISNLSGQINGNSTLHSLNITVYSQSGNVASINDSGLGGYRIIAMALNGSVQGGASETLTTSTTSDQNTNITVGGTVTAGDIVSVNVENSTLSGGENTASYTVQSGDTLTSIATGLAAAINADTTLNTIGVSATSSGAVINTYTNPHYTVSTSTGATETISLGTNNRGNNTVTIGGTPTSGDTLTVTSFSGALSGGQSVSTYTVQSTDTLLTIANGLEAAINANTALQTLGVTAPANVALQSTSQNFSGIAVLPSGTSYASVSAKDGGGNTKTNTSVYSTTGAPSTSLTYDANGNMTSDGTNTYVWDAENRLIQINYPGSGNYSQFTYDAYGHNVKIVESVSSSVTSTKQFVWTSGNLIKEARDGSGAVMAQYFEYGQGVGASSFFYTLDHLRSIREMTSASGVLAAQYLYDPYGRVTKAQGAESSDLQFAGYYMHTRSNLNITVYRPFNASFGRWNNRDPIGEQGGRNLYAYVANAPVRWIDPSGLENPDPIELLGGVDYGPVWGTIAYKLAQQAGIDAANSGIPDWPDGPRDAYRHCLWSCRLAQAMGPSLAEQVGNGHEGGYMWTDSNKMDAANNARGRAAGAGGGDCACKCKALLAAGGLVGPGGTNPIIWPAPPPLTKGFQAPKY
ncbi:MAG TPA: RHS repeat-associated core domain-containing protein [Oculatellaceae cyanobacterium]